VKLLFCSVELKGEELDVVELTVVLEEVPVLDTAIDEDVDDTLEIVIIALVELLLLLAIKLDEDDKVDETPVELENVLSAVLIDVLLADTKLDEDDTLEVRLVELEALLIVTLVEVLLLDFEVDSDNEFEVTLVELDSVLSVVLIGVSLACVEPDDVVALDETPETPMDVVLVKLLLLSVKYIKLEEVLKEVGAVPLVIDESKGELLKLVRLVNVLLDTEGLNEIPLAIIELKDEVVLLMVDEIEPAVDVLRIVAVLGEDNVAVLLKVLENMDTGGLDCVIESVDVDPVVGSETPVGVVHVGGGACAIPLVDSRPRQTWFWGIAYRAKYGVALLKVSVKQNVLINCSTLCTSRGASVVKLRPEFRMRSVESVRHRGDRCLLDSARKKRETGQQEMMEGEKDKERHTSF
jgi:hypothetical protein